MFGKKRRKVGKDQFAYGDIDGERTTIHGSREVNIEVDPRGKVVSVWFRCMLVPFDVNLVDSARAKEMRRAYAGRVLPIDAIIFADEQKEKEGVAVAGPPL
jgi:hypothetical protein